MLQSDCGEYESLLVPTTPHKEKYTKSVEQNKEVDVYTEWNSLHTTYAIVIRILGDVMSKSWVVYYRDYERALNFEDTEFAWLIIFGQFGALCAILLLPFINKVIPKLQNKIAVFGIANGFFGLLIFVPSQIPMNSTTTLTWCCIDRLLFGISFFIYITSILDLAAISTNNSGHQGKVIALLNLSWTFASLCYVIVGFMIQYINWWSSFVIFGFILCFLSAFSKYVFVFDLESSPIPAPPTSPLKYRSNSSKKKSEISWTNDLKTVFCSNICRLIFFATVIMGVFNGSFSVILSSIWMEDIFNMNSTQVGFVTISIFCGELFATLIVSSFVDKYDAFKVSILPFTNIILVSFCCLSLSIHYGANVGGIMVVIIFTFLMYLSWESFFICQQMLCIQNAPTERFMSLMLLANFVCLSAGNVIGTYLSILTWNNGEGMYFINSIWIVCVLITSTIYFILYHLINTKNKENDNVNSIS